MNFLNLLYAKIKFYQAGSTAYKELGVDIDEYVDVNLKLEKELFFIGGKAISTETFLPEFRKLAALIKTDTAPIREKNGTLIYPNRGIPDAAPRLDQMSLAAYFAEKQQQGVSADFITLLNVMYLGMYGLETTDQSVYNLFALLNTESKELAIYGPSDESKRVAGGNSELINALEKAVRTKTTIEMSNRLLRIQDNGTSFTLDFSGLSGTKQVKAERIICTLPFSTLRDVEGVNNLKLAPAKLEAIQRLAYATNSKFTLGYSSAYWEKGSELLRPSYGVIYSDRQVKEVRASSNGQKGTSGIIMNYLSGSAGAIISSNLLNETIDHMNFLYPGSKAILDGNKNLQVWKTESMTKGSYACFRPGHFTAMGGFADLVELEGRLVFAGEHFSANWQGYMEGAIETGNDAAVFVQKRVKM